MSAGQLCDRLGIKGDTRLVAEHWSEVSASLDRATDVLGLQETATLASEASLDDETVSAVRAHLPKRIAEPAWLRFLWLCHLLLYRHGTPVAALPDPSRREEEKMLDRLVLALSGIPSLRAHHSRLSVPLQITRATIRDLSRWTDYYRRQLGCYGITERILDWYQRHTSGLLFEIGRLQFMPADFEGDVRVFRSKETRRIMAFAEDGVRIDSHGLIPPPDGDCESCINTRFNMDDHLVTGHEVDPNGSIERGLESIVASEWEEVLEPGVQVIEIHIPAGAPLDLEACANAVGRANKLIPTWFPKRYLKAFTCEAWLLDPRFEEILGPTSNIVRFGRHLYRYPVAAEPNEALARVFGEIARSGEIDAAPRETGLQRALARHIEEGGTVTAAGGFYLREDLPFREGVYLRQD
jgi:hypothetical protein